MVGAIALFTIYMLEAFLPSRPKDGLALVVVSKENYAIILMGFRKHYVSLPNNPYEVGDLLQVKGIDHALRMREYESRFSFAEYLSKQGVWLELEPESIGWKVRFPIRMNQWISSYLQRYDPLPASFLKSICFGVGDYDLDWVKDASSIGALSYLSASGLLFSWTLRFLERRLWRLDEKKRRIILKIIAGFLFLLLPKKTGILRVLIMRLLPQRISRWGRINLSAFIILSLDFHNLLSQGFLLGFLIAYSFLFYQRVFAKGQGIRRWGRNILYLHGILFPSLVRGNAYHVFSILYALILLPIAVPFLLLGELGFLFRANLSLILGPYSRVLEWVVSFFGKIDVAIPLGNFSKWIILLYYLVYGLSLYLTSAGFKRGGRRFRIGLFVGLSIQALPLGNGLIKEVSFLNVGQGDSILVRDGYHAVLIDTGGNRGFDMAEDVLIPYLRKKRIYTLDALILSHQDFDHAGAKDSLVRHWNVQRVIEDRKSFPLSVGSLRFINLNHVASSEENDRSSVLYLEFMGKRWLFTGDASKEVEKRILMEYPDLKVEVLKAGHHGSKTSSSKEFIEAIDPKIAVISVGYKNSYNHPSKEVLETLKKQGSILYRTDEVGTITFRRMMGIEIPITFGAPRCEIIYNDWDDQGYSLRPT